MKSDIESEFEREKSLLKKDGIKQNRLRQEYEEKVQQLKQLGDELIGAGVSEAEVARILHKKRRELGLEYKKAAPLLFAKYIFYATEKKYGDPLGPDYESLKKVKTPAQIIESASRPIKDLDQRLTIEGFEEWYRETYVGK